MNICFEGFSPSQAPGGTYYAPVHSYHPPEFSNGYTPLQPVSDQLPQVPTAPPATHCPDSAFVGQPVSTMPITVQPMTSGQPIIGFVPPPAYGPPITSQPMPTGPAPMLTGPAPTNYGTPLPGPTGRLMNLPADSCYTIYIHIIILNNPCSQRVGWLPLLLFLSIVLLVWNT